MNNSEVTSSYKQASPDTPDKPSRNRDNLGRLEIDRERTPLLSFPCRLNVAQADRPVPACSIMWSLLWRTFWGCGDEGQQRWEVQFESGSASDGARASELSLNHKKESKNAGSERRLDYCCDSVDESRISGHLPPGGEERR